ncbi:MAG: hypothetical protein LBD72_01220 [Puniceicoccales bacterium]|jgi:hypothetical protein|nr:hypothetical protein [Puniceicoccales bacterium]
MLSGVLPSSRRDAFGSVAEKPTTGKGMHATGKDFFLEIQSTVKNVAVQISDKINLLKNFNIVVELGKYYKQVVSSILLLVSSIPFVGPFFAVGDSRAQNAHATAPKTAAGEQDLNHAAVASEDAAAINAAQAKAEILSGAQTIWCKGFTDGEFILSVDNGANEMRIRSFTELAGCRLQEFSIDDFDGSELDLSQISATNVIIANCQNLKTITGASGVISINFCANLETVNGSSMLQSFQADGCTGLCKLDFSKCVSLREIALQDSKIPERSDLQLPPGASDHTWELLNAEKSVNL